MWSVTADALVNILFILFPLLLYLIFINNKDDIENGKITSKFFITLLLSLILTLSLRTTYTYSYSNDLMIIPVIISFVYIGVWPGMVMSAVVAFDALLFDRPEFIATAVFYGISAGMLSWLARFYKQYSIKGKLTALSLFYGAVGTAKFLYLLYKASGKTLTFSAFNLILTWVTLIAAVFFLEFIIKQLEMKSEWANTEKTNIVSQLAASVAHEIRNPMTTVRGFLQLLSNSDHLTEKDKSFVQLSIGELDRAQNIINEFLALSKPQKRTFSTIDLTKVIQDAVNIISSYATLKNIEIVSVIEPSLTMMGDKYELQQALLNIMKNGIEAMEGKNTLEIYAFNKNQHIQIVVKDHGCGMPPERIKQLGTPYYSTKEKGTGLGLTVSFEIIRKMHGKVDIKSRVNHGTTFTLTFPRFYLE